MTTAEALVTAWICDALNEHVGDDLSAEVERDATGRAQPVVVLRTAIAGRLVVTVTEEPEPRPEEP